MPRCTMCRSTPCRTTGTRYPGAGALPVVEEYYRHCLSLPMFPTLTDEEQDYVIGKVIEYVSR